MDLISTLRYAAQKKKEEEEAAARAAVQTAAKSVRELRIAEVIRQDVTIEDGNVLNYRVRLGISFKYDPE